MARHQWSVLCERALVDDESGSLTLVDVVEDLGIAMEPLEEGKTAAVPIQLALVSSWRRDAEDRPERTECRFEVLSPREQVLATSRPMPIDLSDQDRAHTIGKLEFLPVDVSGTYTLVVQQKSLEGAGWAEAARVRLRVTVKAAQP